MQYLNTNFAGQLLRVSLNESRQYFAETFTDYLLILTHEENSTAGYYLAQVPVILNENQRITTLEITTVGLELAGRYRFEIYGQNSDNNLNSTNAVVVGLCKIGWADLTNNTEFYDVPNITINDDVIYDG
jgi:hypothetical protein